MDLVSPELNLHLLNQSIIANDSLFNYRSYQVDTNPAIEQIE